MPATTPPSLHTTLWVFPEQSVITMKNNVPATDSCIICPQLSVTSWPGGAAPRGGPHPASEGARPCPPSQGTPSKSSCHPTSVSPSGTWGIGANYFKSLKRSRIKQREA